MMSITQRARLLDAIPTDLADLTVKKLRKDRLGNDDYTFPSMRLAILSEGIRTGPNTAGPIRKDYLGINGDAREWIGQHQQASISIILMAESTTSKTDQDTPEVLDQMLYDLQTEIELYRLGLYWPADYMKVVPGSGKVNYLPPFQAKASDEHWIYPAAFDFRVEYEFSVLDDTPNIHAIEYNFGLPYEPIDYIELVDIHPPWYEMSICVRGWYSNAVFDIILQSGSTEVTYSADMILIVD
ncbi:hypothetical protein [Bacteroides sp.]|uniref:hypothetical protein n=1 Tax=Bacteroides sp. TaxID=29523 RepID=UPI002626F107|nr:hypothetical protein [Bacteroides sp.]MDD3040731.1 hypothetical protein [Bacteroides sp.]